jgi:hypothetical protein
MVGKLEWRDIEWGTVPGWLGLLALVFTAATFVIGRRDAGRDLASKVSVIVLSMRWGGGPVTGGQGNHTTAQIRNDSDAPIFDCQIVLFDWGLRHSLWWERTVPEWWTTRRVDGRLIATVLPNSQSANDAAELDGLGLPPQKPESILPPLVLIFRDGNGRHWVRWPDGKLSRLRRAPRWS